MRSAPCIYRKVKKDNRVFRPNSKYVTHGSRTRLWVWLSHSGLSVEKEINLCHSSLFPTWPRLPSSWLGQQTVCAYSCMRAEWTENMRLAWKEKVLINPWSQKSKKNKKRMKCILNDNWHLIKWALYTSNKSLLTWCQMLNHLLYYRDEDKKGDDSSLPNLI